MPKEKGPEWAHVMILTGNPGDGVAIANAKLQYLYCGKQFVGGA